MPQKFAALIILVLLSGSAFAGTTYRVTDLGTLGGTSSIGNAINDNGNAAGSSLDSSGNTRAFYWTPGGGMQNLGIIGTGLSEALDINNNEQVVGDTDNQAFRWTSVTGMVTLDGSNTGSAAALNNNNVAIGSRHVIGSDRTIIWSSTNSANNPFPLWNSDGLAINNLGQFVGIAGSAESGYYSSGIGPSSVGFGVTPTDINDAPDCWKGGRSCHTA